MQAQTPARPVEATNEQARCDLAGSRDPDQAGGSTADQPETAQQRFAETFDRVFRYAKDHGTINLTTDAEPTEGGSIRLGGQRLVHFGSCSYLGLEQHPDVKEGAIAAVRDHGAQFSSSRAYLSLSLYEQLERSLGRILGGHVVVAASTTLAHLAALPWLVGEADAAIVDHQAHASIQMAAQLLVARGTPVRRVRHNDLEGLEAHLLRMRGRHARVWYLADSVYSMYGDLSPLERLDTLQRRHPVLHLYIDDAHGMSWTGARGKGHALSHLRLGERVVVATSLSKGFGAGGGAIAFSDPERAEGLRRCGGTLVFGGPLQPPTLGAAVASARLHLDGEVERLQRRLLAKIRFTRSLLEERRLPVVSRDETPLTFVGIGPYEVAVQTVARLKEEGFFLNVAAYPAVPLKRSGLRIATTVHQSDEDIRRMVDAVARVLPEALAAHGSSVSNVRRAFRVH